MVLLFSYILNPLRLMTSYFFSVLCAYEFCPFTTWNAVHNNQLMYRVKSASNAGSGRFSHFKYRYCWQFLIHILFNCLCLTMFALLNIVLTRIVNLPSQLIIVSLLLCVCARLHVPFTRSSSCTHSLTSLSFPCSHLQCTHTGWRDQKRAHAPWPIYSPQSRSRGEI